MSLAEAPPNASLSILPASGRHAASATKCPRVIYTILISGAEMDLTVHSYVTFDRLSEYCYRVAGTVGLTCTHVFGFSDSRAL